MATFWSNCKLKSKLFIGIGAILAMFALSSAIVLVFVNGLAGSADRALNHITPTRVAALTTEYRLVDADDIAGSYVMDRTAANWPAYIKAYTADIAEIRAELPKLKDGAHSNGERDTLNSFATGFDS